MRKVIYTVIVGGYDEVRPLPTFPGWDFVLLTDRQPSIFSRILSCSNWQTRVFENPGLDVSRYSRLPKLKPYLFLPEYEYSVYIDGNARFEMDPTGLLDLLGWPDFAVSEHPFRDNLYEEFQECRRLGLDDRGLFDRQEAKYRNAGLVDPAPLFENNLILRRHNLENVMKLGEAWFDELCSESKRDQLSLPYICWQKNLMPSIFSQELKKKYFRTRSHRRSMFFRMKKSFRKRLARLSR